jgi:hypothetical protein
MRSCGFSRTVTHQHHNGHALPSLASLLHRAQCPLPDAQLSKRGSLGMRRRYGAAGSDLLAALNRKIFITEQGWDVAASAALEGVGDLVLYDPHEDRPYQERLQALHDAASAAQAAAAAVAAADAAVEAAENGASAGAAVGSEGEGHLDKPEAEGAPAASEAAPAPANRAGGCSIDGWSFDSDDSQQGLAPSIAAAAAAAAAPLLVAPAAAFTGADALRAAAADARAAAATAHAVAAAASRAAGPMRTKVYADAFLVHSLRPHQRVGVQFVFRRLCGTVLEGVSGGVLADGMGLGKTFQTVRPIFMCGL